MEDYYTDMAAWEAENKAFLIKIGQVVETPTITKSKKEED
jgi:hypothetical protein